MENTSLAKICSLIGDIGISDLILLDELVEHGFLQSSPRLDALAHVLTSEPSFESIQTIQTAPSSSSRSVLSYLVSQLCPTGPCARPARALADACGLAGAVLVACACVEAEKSEIENENTTSFVLEYFSRLLPLILRSPSRKLYRALVGAAVSALVTLGINPDGERALCELVSVLSLALEGQWSSLLVRVPSALLAKTLVFADSNLGRKRWGNDLMPLIVPKTANQLSEVSFAGRIASLHPAPSTVTLTAASLLAELDLRPKVGRPKAGAARPLEDANELVLAEYPPKLPLSWATSLMHGLLAGFSAGAVKKELRPVATDCFSLFLGYECSAVRKTLVKTACFVCLGTTSLPPPLQAVPQGAETEAEVLSGEIRRIHGMFAQFGDVNS